jgi:uncharacterized protein (TIGR03067 family)
VRSHKIVVAGRRLTYWTPKGPHEASFELRPTGKPSEIDMQFVEGAVTRGIYELEGDHLKLRWTKLGDRPTGFDTTDGDIMAIQFVFAKKP